MSALADRIRTIVKPRSPQAEAASQAFEVCFSDGNPSSDPCAVLGGTVRDGCLVVERRWRGTARHGCESIRSLADRLAASAPHASYFAGGAPPRAPFMFFDVETTGLSGGAGTQVFLVGTGWFDDGDFLTRQFVMTRYADEQPMLRTVADECGRAGALVSFNGKSFDVPVLETRYLFHRLRPFASELPHIDVLHPARQFWKREDCSLAALEQHLLGCRRTGDVHGFEVPARYFHFVRSGDPRPLAAVLEHNRLDLLSLAALTARLLHVVSNGPAAVRDGREALALGHVYARAGLDALAREAYARALALSRAPHGAYDPVRIDALRALAIAWRRARQYEDAAGCWRELLAIRGCPPTVAREAAEALAVHSEHRLKDYLTARAYVLDRFEEWPAGRKRDAITYRLERLERKLGRTAGPQTADLFGE